MATPRRHVAEGVCILRRLGGHPAPQNIPILLITDLARCSRPALSFPVILHLHNPARHTWGYRWHMVLALRRNILAYCRLCLVSCRLQPLPFRTTKAIATDFRGCSIAEGIS